MATKIGLFVAGLSLVALGYFSAMIWSPATGSNPSSSHGGRPGGGGGYGAPSKATSRPAGYGGAPGKAIAVSVAPTAITTIRERVASSGVLMPERTVDIVARVEGDIEEIAHEDGDVIAAGVELLAIDRRALEIRRETARIERDRTQAEFRRFEALKGSRAASDKELEDARFNLERAVAAYNEAELELSYSRPVAPFAGVIVKRQVEVGQHVRAGDPLFTLADFDPLLLKVYLPEREVARLQVGHPVELRRSEELPVEATGTVLRISPIVDRESLAVEVTLAFSAPPSEIRPGSFVRVDIITRTLDDVLLVPRAAVRRGDGLPAHVFRVQGDHVEKIEVVCGFEDEEVVQIREGLGPEDVVVVEGGRDLQDGTRVNTHRERAMHAPPVTVPVESKKRAKP